MVNNQAYRDYCMAHRGSLPIFYQDWWLDAVVGQDQWEGLISKTPYKQRHVIMPIYKVRSYGFEQIVRPPLTTYQGPYWAGLEQLTVLEQQDMVNRLWPDLIKQQPEVARYQQVLHPDVTIARPFAEAGYRLQLRYTQYIPLQRSPAAIFKEFRRDTRRNINKATEQLNVSPTGDIERFIPLVSAVYRRQGMQTLVDGELLRRIFSAGQQRDQVQMWRANYHAEQVGGLITFHDAHSVYLVVSGLNEQGRRLGAMQLLVWTALQYYTSTHQVFDFCGSMIPAIAKSNRSFGAISRPVIEVQRQSRLFQLGLILKGA